MSAQVLENQIKNIFLRLEGISRGGESVCSIMLRCRLQSNNISGSQLGVQDVLCNRTCDIAGIRLPKLSFLVANAVLFMQPLLTALGATHAVAYSLFKKCGMFTNVEL
ncbi:MAG: hypothetical protein ACK5MG_00110 [Bacteroidales bacterium]